MDARDPDALAIVGNVDTPRFAYDVAAAGHHAYVASGFAGLQVVDVSDPTRPEIVGGAVALNRALGVAVSGSHAYLADRFSGVRVIDVSDPTSPRVLGSVDIGGDARAVAVAGSVVCVADHVSGLQVVPGQCGGTTPVLLSGFRAVPQGRGVLLTWSTSYEDRHAGFHVYRSERLDSGYERRTAALVREYRYLDRAVAPSGVYFYRLGDVGVDGRETLHPPVQVTTPAWRPGTSLAVPSPSPFRRSTTIRFTLAAAAHVRLAVHDVAGRRVRRLVEAVLPAEDHHVVWDGRDEAGRRVAGGTYFLELSTDGVTYGRKVVFLGAEG
jgi:hypothetical protein